MNYVELHLGDYAEATAHLSFVEDSAYMRLLRKYYATEQPIPADFRAAQRLVGARTKDEREAVETVLQEFFDLRADGWHNERADTEIAKYLAKQEKARQSANARWNAVRPHSGMDANASDKTMRTHSDGNAHQTPSTNHQSPDVEQASRQDTEIPQGAGSGLTPAGVLSVAMNRAGCRVTSMNPTLLAAAGEGVTPEHLAQLIGLHPGKPAGYVLAIARREHAEQAQPITPGEPHGHSAERGAARPRNDAVAQVERAITERRDREARAGEGRTLDA